MEKMLATFLKAMGISPELIQGKVEEFTATVKAYDARLARIEANQRLIMQALKIPASDAPALVDKSAA